VIVRISGEGQFSIDDVATAELIVALIKKNYIAAS